MLNKNKLKGAIIAAGYTSKEIATKLGMSENTFSSKMSGKSSFDILQAYEICEILRIENNAEKAEIFLTTSSQN